MRITPFLLTAMLIIAAVISARPAPSLAAQPAVANVTIEDYSFKAPSITVPVGTTVVWKNLDDDPHTVTAVDDSFDSKGLAQGDTFSHQFLKPGKYQYYCKVHPMMKGTVVVTGGSS